MAKKIRISGEIGWTVLSSDILDQIDEAAGEDLDIEIASPGGSVYTGIEIYNGLRDYKKKNPNAQIMITITGLAASMASYIAAIDVADLVAAYDNTVGMYHNPWNFAMGDYREMKKNAEMLEGLTGLLAKAYVKRSGKSRTEIAEIMDNETWLFGEELKEYGFVDEIIETEESDEDKASAIASAKLQFKEMEIHARDHEEDPERVAAIIKTVSESVSTVDTPVRTREHANGKTNNSNDKSAVGGNKRTPEGGKRGKTMDRKELQSEHPELYEEVEASGAKKVKDRITKCLALMKRPEIAKREAIVARIQEGIDKDEEYNEIVLSVTAMLTLEAESPGDIDTGIVDSPTGELQQGGKKETEPAAWKPGQLEEV